MAWVELPDLIFSDIMLLVGLESIEGLHRCRQVCSTWNEKILRHIWESEKKKKKMKRSFVLKWRWIPNQPIGRGEVFPSNEEISHAKWLGDGFLFCLLLFKMRTPTSL